MKNYYIVFILVFLFSISSQIQSQTIYDSKLVETYDATYNGEKLQMVKINRKGERIKAKYFAAKDYYNNKDVYHRYLDWAKGRKIVMACSGTYMDTYGVPVGLTIDNGIPVTQSIANWDGLVIVYATGGVVVTNLENGDLKVKYTSNSTEYTFTNLQSSTQLERFIDWAKLESATVFQTHLLIFKNTLGVFTPSMYQGNSAQLRERRFLVGVKDADNNVCHIIINLPEIKNTLYSGAKTAKTFLSEEMGITDIIYMINLDTGNGDCLRFYNQYGTESTAIKGPNDLSIAANLLVYYYE